jgi:hypothetical protein
VREPVAELKPHSAGVGEDWHPKEKQNGFKTFVAELVCCPICSGTWGALALMYLPKQFTYIFAAVAVLWVVVYLTELVEWKRHEAQETVGLLKRKGEVEHDYPDIYNPKAVK